MRWVSWELLIFNLQFFPYGTEKTSKRVADAKKRKSRRDYGVSFAVSYFFEAHEALLERGNAEEIAAEM